MFADFSRRFKQFRLEIGFSQQEMAAFLGVNQRYISEAETTKANIKIEYIQKLHLYKKLNLDWFFTGKGKPQLNESVKPSLLSTMELISENAVIKAKVDHLETLTGKLFNELYKLKSQVVNTNSGA